MARYYRARYKNLIPPLVPYYREENPDDPETPFYKIDKGEYTEDSLRVIKVNPEAAVFTFAQLIDSGLLADSKIDTEDDRGIRVEMDDGVTTKTSTYLQLSVPWSTFGVSGFIIGSPNKLVTAFRTRDGDSPSRYSMDQGNFTLNNILQVPVCASVIGVDAKRFNYESIYFIPKEEESNPNPIMPLIVSGTIKSMNRTMDQQYVREEGNIDRFFGWAFMYPIWVQYPTYSAEYDRYKSVCGLTRISVNPSENELSYIKNNDLHSQFNHLAMVYKDTQTGNEIELIDFYVYYQNIANR